MSLLTNTLKNINSDTLTTGASFATSGVNIKNAVNEDTVTTAKKNLTELIQKKTAKGAYAPYTSFKNFYTDIKKRGITQSNKFMVKFNKIPFSTSGMASTTEMGQLIAKAGENSFLTFSCEGASFPTTTFSTSSQINNAYDEDFIHKRTYGDVTLSFRCDAAMTERKFFDIWSNAMVSKATGLFSYKSSYITTIDIIQFDNSLTPVYAITLEDAYPTSIGEIDLGYADNDSYNKFEVTFSYTKFVVQNIDEAVENMNKDVESNSSTPDGATPGIVSDGASKEAKENAQTKFTQEKALSNAQKNFTEVPRTDAFKNFGGVSMDGSSGFSSMPKI